MDEDEFEELVNQTADRAKSQFNRNREIISIVVFAFSVVILALYFNIQSTNIDIANNISNITQKQNSLSPPTSINQPDVSHMITMPDLSGYMTFLLWNSTNTSYALNTTLSGMAWNQTNTSYMIYSSWNSTNTTYALNTTLSTLAWNQTNTSYMTFANWNSTNSSYANTTSPVFQALTVRQSAPPSIDYGNFQGSGNRASGSNMVVVASDFSWHYTSSQQELVDGVKTGTGDYWLGIPVTTSMWLRFDFGVANQKVITEIKYYQQDATGQGVWKVQGSNDGATWTDVSDSFTLGGIATETIPVSLSGVTNAGAYRFYQLVGISGAMSATPYIYEFEFKIGAITTTTIDSNNFLSNLNIGSKTASAPFINIMGGVKGSIGVEMSSGNAPTASVALSGGSVADGTYYYVTTTTDVLSGESVRSPESAPVVVSGGGGSAKVSVNVDQVNPVGAVTWRVYRTTTSGTYTTPSYIGATSTVGGSVISDTFATPAAGSPPTTGSALTSRINGFGTSYFGGGQFTIYGTTVDTGLIQLGNQGSSQYAQFDFSDTGNNYLKIRTGYTGNGNYIAILPGNSESMRFTKGTNNIASITGALTTTGNVTTGGNYTFTSGWTIQNESTSGNLTFWNATKPTMCLDWRTGTLWVEGCSRKV